MKKTIFAMFFLASFATMATSGAIRNYSDAEKPYVEKYRKILSALSMDISGEQNNDAIVFEAATTSNNSGRVIFKNVVFFGETWDFSEHFFEKNRITSSSIVKTFPNDRLAKISFENVSNKIYKKFNALPKESDSKCISVVSGDGSRCYRVFDLPSQNHSLELSIYNKKIVLNMNGGEDEKK